MRYMGYGHICESALIFGVQCVPLMHMHPLVLGLFLGTLFKKKN